MSLTENNHYISEYLLRPWMFKKGMVRIFDYKKNTFEDRETATLFSRTKLFTQTQENFFNKYIENISSQELQSIASSDLKIKKWKNYRAILLLIFDLIGRYTAAINGKCDSVDFFTALDEEGLDKLACVILSDYEIGVITIPPEGVLSFPSNFIIPLFDPLLKDCHFGVPIHGNHALFLLKKGFDNAYLNTVSNNHTLINLSVGNANTDLVVIHPGCSVNEAELSPRLAEQRKLNQELANQIGQLLNFLRAYESVIKSFSVP